MATQTVTVTDNGINLLTLHSGVTTWEESDFVLLDFDGWDDFKNISIDTVPKLFGHGSYVVSKTIDERDFSIKGAINTPTARNTRDAIALAAENLNPVTVTLTRGNSNSILEAYIVSLEWDMTSEAEAQFTISFKSLNPLKTVGAETIL